MADPTPSHNDIPEIPPQPKRWRAVAGGGGGFSAPSIEPPGQRRHCAASKRENYSENGRNGVPGAKQGNHLHFPPLHRLLLLLLLLLLDWAYLDVA